MQQATKNLILHGVIAGAMLIAAVTIAAGSTPEPWVRTASVGAIGVAAGAGGAALLARWMLARQLRRVRALERRARVAERMAEIGAMTGGLAHEIKNPLSTIGLNAQLLAESVDDLPIDPEERGRLTRRMGALKREVERLRGILDDFLKFAGEIRPDPRPTDLNVIVEELVDFYLPQAEKNGVRIRTDLARGPLIAPLDAAMVKQAVLNLMLNAVQAMADGPAGPRELLLRTRRDSDPDGRPVAVLHVVDTGPGMDQATRERIFQPYFTTKPGGTGLGLPTARRLVEAHDGRVEVHAAPGTGADFALTFPA